MSFWHAFSLVELAYPFVDIIHHFRESNLHRLPFLFCSFWNWVI